MKLNFTLLFLLLTGCIFAQIRKIPTEVITVFQERYPHAGNVSWKDNSSSFKARFTLNNYEVSAVFNGSGEWQRTERKMAFNDLPHVVKKGFAKSKYIQWEKSSVTEVDKNGEAIEYLLVVKKDKVSKKHLCFDIHGKLKTETSF